MDVVILGSGSPLPSPDRAGPSTLVRAGGQNLLFDCGRGVLLRTTAVGVMPNNLAAVLLTHLHSDHVTDFNDVVTSAWVGSFSPTPLPVVGPIGTQGFADATVAMLAPDISYRLAHHEDLTWEPLVEVQEVDHGEVRDVGGVRIVAAPTDHKPVHPTVGYRVEADGASVVIAGDTVPCEGLDELCAGATVYVQTVIRRSLVEAIPIPRLQDILDYHSSVEQAAQTAARAGAGTLVLTHYVPALQPGEEDAWRGLAAAHFDGRVELGDDLHRVEI